MTRGRNNQSGRLGEALRKPAVSLLLGAALACIILYTTVLSNRSEDHDAGIAQQYARRISQMELEFAKLSEIDKGKSELIQQMNTQVLDSLVQRGEDRQKSEQEEEQKARELEREIEVRIKRDADEELNKYRKDMAKMTEKIKVLQMQIPKVKQEKRAFLTLVTNNFWKQGIVLVQSARDRGVTHPFVVMAVDPDGISPSDPTFVKLPQEAEDAFERLNAEVRYIEPVPIPPNAAFDNPRWSIAWNKLRAFEFTEFDKLVFLDSDMFVRQDVTEMLTFPEFSSAPGHDIPCETHHGINGGVLIFRPNQTIYNELIAFSNSGFSNWRAAEQELLGHFYMTYYKHDFHLISGLYNISLRSCQCLAPVVFSDHVKVIHFYSGNKPWDHTKEEWANPNLDIENRCIADICIEWYNVLERGLTPSSV